MSLLWQSEALVAAMNGRPVGALPAGVGGISIDTRTLQPGEAFFAIKGERFDGHDFATAAAKAGAGILVVAEGKLPALGRVNTPLIVVKDVLAALEMAGAAARERTKAKIIGVTGSVGKTSTKEALRTALSAVGKVHAADRSFNNHWGVPLSLARMPEDSDYAIFEIGMSHPGEIRPLSRLVRPDIAIVTMVAAAHLGHFSSLDEIAAAKAEIFEGVERGGHALINRDDPRWKLLEKAAREAGIEHVWGFGEHARATFRLMSCEIGPESSEITAKLAGQAISARVGAPGRHQVQNALAVMGAAYLAGAEMTSVAAALAYLQAERGRGQRHQLKLRNGVMTLIDESYNANPASMKAAIELLRSTPVGEGGRRIAVLGDMLELGEHSAKLHAGLSEHLAPGVDVVMLAGKEMQALVGRLPGEIKVEHFADAEELRPALIKAAGPGDVVMLKSSNGVGFSRLVEAFLSAYPKVAAARGDQPVLN
jgi:UDP-N-acetylmuramoyl-tripeptide--D-alanyl-D-alanine ligase